MSSTANGSGPSPAARPGTQADGVQGVVPRQVVAVSSVEEASATLAEASSERRSVVFVGGGTDLGLGAPPRALDTLVKTERLTRVLEHSPSDQIVVAEAGLTLDALARVLAPHGQRLALDPPFPDRATLGGVVAANAFGPLRARYGGPRDLLIGITIVRADGTVAKGGGKVVKNVAGFDLPRMMVGSIGTLGLVAVAAFRLHPIPEVTATLLFRGRDAAGVLALVRGLRERQLEPSSVTSLSSREAGDTSDAWDTAIVFEGFASGVGQQVDRLTDLARETGTPCEVASETDAARFRALHDGRRTTPSLRLKVSAPPAAFGAEAKEALALLSTSLGGSDTAWYPTLGLAFVGAENLDQAGPAILEARASFEEAGGSLVAVSLPDRLRNTLDPWGDAGNAFPVMNQLKARLDPAALLAPGRFVGGL